MLKLSIYIYLLRISMTILKEGKKMPIVIPNDLPAAKTLTDENVFIMLESRAVAQDIRPLKVAIVNLMPTKITTETQLLRLVGNTPIQVDVDFINMKSHVSKNTSENHLERFYKSFDEIKNKRYDGMIITGAPVETMEFEDVDYWNELTEIMEYSKTNVFSTLHICWGAMAGLYYHYGISKYELKEKMFGVFAHKILDKKSQILKGFDDEFYVPHSRHVEIRREDIEKVPDLKILSESETAGVYLVEAQGGRQLFLTGHSEYDPLTLKTEYERDIKNGLNIKVPCNYFKNDDPNNEPVVKWRSHANLLYSNWLNFFVYEETLYDF